MKNKNSIFRTLYAISLIGIFLSVALIILAVTKTIDGPLFKIAGIVMILCLSCTMIIPWLRIILNDRQKAENPGRYNVLRIISYCFIGLTAVCCILWIAAVFVSGNLTTAVHNDDPAKFAACLRFFKFAIIITIQVAIITLIATTILRLGKKYIILQTIAYLSGIFLDICLIIVFASIGITSGGDFKVDDSLFIFTYKAMWVSMIIAGVFLAISVGMLSSIRWRKRGYRYGYGRRPARLDTIDDMIEATEGPEEHAPDIQPVVNSAKSVPDKLADLKLMLDNGLITEEEYARKRQQIIDEM